MSTRTATASQEPARAPLSSRILDALARHFGRSLVSREAVELAWLDTGLGRPNRAMLEDIGAPPEEIARAELREAWKTGWALDAARRL